MCRHSGVVFSTRVRFQGVFLFGACATYLCVFLLTDMQLGLGVLIVHRCECTEGGVLVLLHLHHHYCCLGLSLYPPEVSSSSYQCCVVADTHTHGVFTVIQSV